MKQGRHSRSALVSARHADHLNGVESLCRLLACSGMALLAGCWASAPVKPEEAPPVVITSAASPESKVPLPDRPDMEWWRRSMDTRDERLSWFRQGRFGMFVHWGVYSHVGGIWEGKKVEGYSEHLMRKMKIPSAVYREKLVAQFNPTEFNADEWIGLAKSAGMAYFIITAKHHDGFAMFDSEVSDYNVVKASPWKRDPMKELRAACQRHGIKFGFYYSQAWEWHHPDAPGNDWERDNPGGDRRLWGPKWWETNPEFLTRVRNYVDGKAIPQVKELIAKYDPDIIWFDTPSRLPPEENLRVLQAARAAKPNLVVNSRICQSVPGGPAANFGDYRSTADKPTEFPPHDGVWEAIPTTNESYGWHQGDASHKPPGHFIELLAKAAARGGNVLLNVGPMGNGKIDPKDVAILEGVGAWMKLNGEAIRGTERTPLPVQAWGESTRRGNTLYLHVLSWPRKGRILVGGLKSAVKRAYLLAEPGRRGTLVARRAGQLDLLVQGPARAPHPVNTVIALELEGEPVVDQRRLLSSEVPLDTLRAFDGGLQGGLTFGAGKAQDAHILNWSRLTDSVRWPVRLREAASFEVAVLYDAPAASVGSTFQVKLGEKTLPGTVTATKGPVTLGRVTLPAGTFDITVTGTMIQGGELFRLRGLSLAPVSEAITRERSTTSAERSALLSR
jgi:alpha-L-fucosidase